VDAGTISQPIARSRGHTHTPGLGSSLHGDTGGSGSHTHAHLEDLSTRISLMSLDTTNTCKGPCHSPHTEQQRLAVGGAPERLSPYLTSRTTRMAFNRMTVPWSVSSPTMSKGRKEIWGTRAQHPGGRALQGATATGTHQGPYSYPPLPPPWVPARTTSTHSHLVAYDLEISFRLTNQYPLRSSNLAVMKCRTKSCVGCSHRSADVRG